MAGSLNPDFDSVVDGLNEILLGAEIAFGGLDGGVAEEQLNLLQFPARLAAQLGTGSAQIMGRQIRMSDRRARPPYECVDQILTDRLRRSDFSALAQGPK